MKEITEKLHRKVMEDFHPIAERLANEGKDKNFIVAAFQSQLRIKVQQYYNNLKGMQSIRNVFKQIDWLQEGQSPDSKAEAIFYDMLTNSGIKFDFQYSIGPYRADYLFGGFLVVELDGPHHDKIHDAKRDAYMRKMGYKIIRVPVWILVSCPDALIDEIKEVLATKQ